MKTHPWWVRQQLVLALSIAALAAEERPREVWKARYSSGPNTANEALAITVDAAGYIYVTGESESTNGLGSDFVTLKFSSAGSLLWSARYDGPGHGSDVPAAIAVTLSGNTVVSGTSLGVAGNSDIATIWYDAHGQEIAARRYDGPGHGEDVGNAMVLDASGNVYVTGRAYISTTTGWPRGSTLDTHFATLKYSAAGEELWARTYGGLNRHEGQSIVLDHTGWVHVGGPSVFYPDPRAPGAHWIILTYTPEGVLTNKTSAAGGANGLGLNSPVRLALDSQGDILAHGWVTDWATQPMYKKRPNLTTLWQVDLFARKTTGLVIGPDDSSFLLAASYNYLSHPKRDYSLLKFSLNGDLLWEAGFGTPDTDDVPAALAVDSSHNIYVTGRSPGASGHDEITTLKYPDAASPAWVARLGSTAGPSTGNAIAIGAEGCVLVAGSTPVRENAGTDLIIICYQSADADIHVELLNNREILLTWSAPPGQPSQLWCSSNLVDWAECGSSLADTIGQCSLCLPIVGNSWRFFRSLHP